MTQRRRIEHVPGRALILGSLLSILVSCGATDQLEDLTIQRDHLKEALDNTVEQLERERITVKATKANVDRVTSDLEVEKKKVEELSDAVERITSQKTALEDALKKQTTEFAKLRETHKKLGTMAQESLDELSELRQRNESLDSEKQAFATKAVVLNKQVGTLSRQVDDLRIELDKTRKAVEVIQSNGDEDAEKSELTRVLKENNRLHDVMAAQKEQIVTLSTELVELRGQLSKFDEFQQETADAVTDPTKLWASSKDLFQDRYKKALNGEIAWDVFDVVVVSIAGGLVVCSLLWLLFVVRHFKLRRRYKQSLLEADDLEHQLYELEQELEEHDAAAAAPAPAHSPRQSFREEEAADARSSRLSPNEFSPIMRTQREPERQQETVAISASAAPAAQRPQAQAKRAPQQQAASRRVIGAYREDTGPQQAAGRPAAPAPAAAAQSAPPLADEDTGAQTQIISEADIDLLADSGALQPSNLQLSSAKRGAQQQKKAAPPQAQPAQAAPPQAAPPQAAPPQAQPSGGTNEEQELLDELKHIINKKFDDVLTDDE